jgi:putative peptide zinc metalloprotease protein
MARFEPDAHVAVRSFARNHEGENVTIGLLDQQAFVTIPAEGLEILDVLAEGGTVGEALRRYEQAHAETPDIADFLEALEQAGFVAEPGSGVNDASAAPGGAGDPSDSGGTDDGVLRWISPTAARRALSAPVLCAGAIAIAVGLGLIATDHSLVPGVTVLVFHRHLAEWTAVMFAVATAGVLAHESGHVIAARAAGVPARVRISHRLWVLVVETDMTGIWLASKRSRQLAFLAGALVDAVTSAALVGVEWATRQGWLTLPPTMRRFLAATLLTYLLRLLWQCFVFVRTDFYYVLATALDCKNLLADTEDLMRNWVARALGRRPVVDQAAIPARELRAIRAYTGVWFAGRLLAFASLIFVMLPVLAGYGTEIVRTVTGGRPSYGAADLLTIAVLVVGIQVAGFVLWIHALYQSKAKGALQ